MFEELVIREICENTSYTLDLEEGFSLYKKDRTQQGLACITRGAIQYRFEDRWYPAKTGSIVFLPKDKPYFIQCTENSTYMIVNFQADGLENRLQLYTVASLEPYIKLFQAMSHEGASIHPLRKMADLYTIFATLSVELVQTKKKRIVCHISRSVAYMQEHLADPSIQMQRIAEESQISVVYFRKIFKKEYGQPPMQWLYAQRIQKAKELLAEQDMRVAEVARVCGYSDIYSFSGAFKRAVGVSPMEYRKRFL